MPETMRWTIATSKQVGNTVTNGMVLVDCLLLSLIAEPYKAKFTLKRYNNPNMNFKLAFQTFLEGFGATTEHDREENKTQDESPLDPPRRMADSSEAH